MNIAERAHEAYGGARRIRVIAEHFANLLPRDAKVLDVGCGSGQLDAGLLARRGDLTLCGIDVLAQPDASIPVEAYDGRTIPYPDESFDAVLFSDVLHHCEAPADVLAEAVRVARTCIAIKDHTLRGPLSRALLRFMDQVGNRRFGVSLPYNYWTEERWRRAFRDLELRCDAWIPKLGLYPVPIDWIFGRSLHFVALLHLARVDGPDTARVDHPDSVPSARGGGPPVA